MPIPHKDVLWYVKCVSCVLLYYFGAFYEGRYEVMYHTVSYIKLGGLLEFVCMKMACEIWGTYFHPLAREL